MNKGKIIVVSAPSGAGKTSLLKKVFEVFPDLKFSVSATTRKKRINEVDGKDYFFIDEETFQNKIDNNEFAEWEMFYDLYYGTYKSQLISAIESGNNIVLELDVKGALSIKMHYPEAKLVFIEPPSYETLVERLKNRKTETEEEFQKRIQRAKMELNQKGNFDYLVVNDNFDFALKELIKILNNILTKE